MSLSTRPTTLPRGLASSGSDAPELSVIVLVTGEPEPPEGLYRELREAVRGTCSELEFVFVLEPRFVGMIEALSELADRGEPIRIVRVGQELGQTRLLRVGLPYCRGSIILTVPGRRRVDSAALPKLVEAVQGGADMAIASRGFRRESWMGEVRSRVFHALVNRVVRAPAEVADVTSGVRAIRREVFDAVPLYGDSATVLPLLAAREGYSVVEVPAKRHEADKTGGGFHSPHVYLRTLFDLFGLFFLLRFTEKPLRFFGLVGLGAVLPGTLILALVVVQRVGGRPAADRPLLLLGMLFVVLGIQMIALGLVGEIIVHLHAGRRPTYRLRD